jgi:hypothetical protein
VFLRRIACVSAPAPYLLMPNRSRLTSFSWLPVVVLACVFAAWSASVRLARIDYLSAQPGGGVSEDAKSLTGYTAERRHVILPERDLSAMEWVRQAQQTAATRQWRLEQITYDNAPLGRSTHRSALYRWWLEFSGNVHRAVTDGSTGRSIERGALWADVVLHILLIASGCTFAALQWGSAAAIVLCAGLLGLYPLGATFAAGQPDERSLFLFFATWMMLPLLSAYSRPPGGNTAGDASNPRHRPRAGWWVSGICGGLATWVDAHAAVPLLLGVVIAATLNTRATWLPAAVHSSNRRSRGWIHWSCVAAVVAAIGYSLESAPRLSFTTSQHNPLYAVLWAAGGVTVLLSLRATRADCSRSDRVIAWSALILFAAAGAMLYLIGRPSALSLEPRLLLPSKLADSEPALGFTQWFTRNFASSPLLAATLPLLVLLAVAWFSRAHFRDASKAAAASLNVGLLAVALLFAMLETRSWALASLSALTLAVITTSALSLSAHGSAARRAGSLAALALALIAGVGITIAPRTIRRNAPLQEHDVTSLIERDLGHWLSARSGASKPIVLASPNTSAALGFFGGFRTLASPYPENRDGTAAALRIASSTLQDEAQAMAEKRKITHVVLTSWDTFLDEYAHAATQGASNSFVALCRQYLAPRWLRPIAYPLPEIPGEERAVIVYQVVELQEQVVALSRLAEYFVDMGMLENAGAVAATLEEHFPEDLGSLIARAQVAVAIDNPDRFRSAMGAALASLQSDAGEALLYDQRIALALMLAQGESFDLARQQAERCIEEASEENIRIVSPMNLFRFLGLIKAMGLSLDPASHQAALRRVPGEMRGHL